MKKRMALFAAILMIMAAMTGCNKNGEGEQSETSETEASVSVTAANETEPPETKALDSDREEETAEEIPEPESDLNELKYKELEQLFGNLTQIKGEDGEEMFDQESDVSVLKVVSPSEVAIGKDYTAELYRESADMLCVNLGDRDHTDSFKTAVKDTKRSRFANELSEYEIKDNDVILKISYDDEFRPEILDVTCSYTIDELSFCGFVCEQKDGTYSFVIDPAYMYNVPVPLFAGDEYSINGKKVLMDTVSFTADKLAEQKFEYTDHVYAQVTVKDLTVSYSKHGNNYSSAEVTAFEVIEEDALKVLDSSELVQKFTEKGDGSAEIYRTLLDNISMFMGDDVVGVQLVDLDFDSTPELLVSREYKDNDDTENTFGNACGADVDIYTVNGGKTKYVDTIHNRADTAYMRNANIIGVKTTDKLEKTWYYCCRGVIDGGVYTEGTDSADYLFTLEYGRLNYTEIFGKKFTDFKPGSDVPMFDYYFYGNKLVPEISGDKMRWNGFEAVNDVWGTGDIYCLMKNEYCSGIKPVYSLYSDWLFDGSKKISASERIIQYKLVQLVDAFYNGENPALMNDYIYRFTPDDPSDL